VQGELNGELIKSRLEVEGIPTMLRFETYFNLKLGVFCPVSVLVPHQFAETGKNIVESIGPNLVSTIPKKNKWSFIFLWLLSLVFGNS